METLFSFVILLVLLVTGGSVLTGFLAGGRRGNQPWDILWRIVRWTLLATLVLTFFPLVLLLALGIWLLSPKARISSTYWGHVLANATTGLWNKVFGPPKVRIYRSSRHKALKRRRRLSYWRN